MNAQQKRKAELNDNDVLMARLDAFLSGAVVDPQLPISVGLVRQLAEQKDKGFDWLLAESKRLAKAVKLEIAVELGIFTFKDGSQLALLQDGNCYAVASSSDVCKAKIEDWLLKQGIGPKQ